MSNFDKSFFATLAQICAIGSSSIFFILLFFDKYDSIGLIKNLFLTPNC